MTDKGDQLNFAGLVAAIRQVHEHCASQAGKAINVSLTLRNWVIGFFCIDRLSATALAKAQRVILERMEQSARLPHV